MVGALAAVVIFFSMMLVSIATIFTAHGARAEVHAADPAYASRLYRGSLAALVANNSPIRFWVLFRVEPPPKLKATVSMLRWLYGLSVALYAAFIGVIVVMAS